jgi:hypothetical protein
MKTRRNKHNQRGGVKVNPNDDPIHALTRGMRSLRFGLKKSKPSRFGAKTKKHRFVKKSALHTLNRNHTAKKSAKKPAKTLRGLVKTKLIQRENKPFHMEEFEPANYVRKVGGVLKGLGDVRERIETRGKTQLLDGFDMIISNIYEGLPKIQSALGQSNNVNMNGSNHSEDIDDMLEEIEDVGEELVELSNTYRKRVKHTNQNLSNIQVQLTQVAEAVNQVLVHSVTQAPTHNAGSTNESMNQVVTQLEGMNVKESSVDELSALLSGLGL